MIYFTKYSENKFDILNRHKVFFRKEQVEEAVAAPDKQGRKTNFSTAQKDKLKVIYKKEDEVIKIITFYPIK